jgi:hypothetical protein
MPQIFYIWSNMRLKFVSLRNLCSSCSLRASTAGASKMHMIMWTTDIYTKALKRMARWWEAVKSIICRRLDKENKVVVGRRSKCKKNVGVQSMVPVHLAWFVKLFKCWDGHCGLALVREALQVLRWSLCTWLALWSSSGVEIFVHLASQWCS